MDKRKYQTKTLIAEYQDYCRCEEFRYKEMAYRLKDGSIIIEYDGKPLSLYGLRIGFRKCIPRKGVFSISESEYSLWKAVRKKDKEGCFLDWEIDIEELMNGDYESSLKCVGENELPF